MKKSALSACKATMFARRAAVFACKAAVLYFIFNLVLTLVVNRLPISIAISWHALLGVVLFFIVCFVIDFILRCIFNGKKAADGVSSDAEAIK